MDHDRCFGCMSPLDGPVCPRCGWSPEDRNDPHQLPAGTELAGRYLLGRVLGQGGFGITYLGWDLEEERTVCIKEFYPSGIANRDTEVSLQINCNTSQQEPIFDAGKARFLREAKALDLFREVPQVVTLYDTLEENGTAYMIMEFIRGFDLHQYMRKREHPLTMDETLRILQPVAEALMMIHKEELVHRDIAPDNIMLHPIEGAKLLDFGAVRLVEDAGTNKELDKSTEMILKNGFAPTEQYASRGSLGPWTDVYAFSATIYYCLTKRIPENAPIRMLENDTLDWTGAVGISPEQKRALEKGMAVRAPERIASIRELMDALYCTGDSESDPSRKDPTPDKPPIPPNPLPKKKAATKKTPGRLLVAAVIAVLLLAGTLGGYFGSVAMAKDAALSHNFQLADSLLFLPSVTKLHDSLLISYIQAGTLLDRGDFSGAKAAFTALGDQFDAKELTLECDYRHALLLLEQGSYREALPLLEFLKDEGYADATAQFDKANFLRGQSLAEAGDYINAYSHLSLCPDYPGAEEALASLKARMYTEAKRLYANGTPSQAKNLFVLLGDYEETEKYLELIRCNNWSANFAAAEEKVQTLQSLFGFEDSAQLLVSNTYFGCWALLGNWVSSSGENYLEMTMEDPTQKDSFYCSWELPCPNESMDYFDIVDGDFCGQYKSVKKPLFRLTFLSLDTLEVYCYEDGSNYILHKE